MTPYEVVFIEPPSYYQVGDKMERTVCLLPIPVGTIKPTSDGGWMQVIENVGVVQHFTKDEIVWKA